MNTAERIKQRADRQRWDCTRLTSHCRQLAKNRRVLKRRGELWVQYRFDDGSVLEKPF